MTFLTQKWASFMSDIRNSTAPANVQESFEDNIKSNDHFYNTCTFFFF